MVWYCVKHTQVKYKSVYNHINPYKIMFSKCKYRIYHAVNENGSAETVAPTKVLGVSSSITLACELS